MLVPSASSGSLDLDIVSMETEESRDSPITTDTEKIPIFKDPNFVVCINPFFGLILYIPVNSFSVILG